MKYLIRLIILSFLLSIAVACSNDSGTGSVKRKSELKYRDLHIYRGSADGPEEVLIDTVRMDTTWKTVDKPQEDGSVVKVKEVAKIDTVYLDVDSLYTTLVMNRYFVSIYSTEIKDRNSIEFEFLDQDINMLRYIGENSAGKRATIISSYEYKEDTLNILEGGVTPVLVAIKSGTTGDFHRTLGLILPKLDTQTPPIEAGEITNNVPLKPKDNEEITIESALKAIGFDDPSAFTNKDDSVVWCNLKYIYR